MWNKSQEMCSIGTWGLDKSVVEMGCGGYWWDYHDHPVKTRWLKTKTLERQPLIEDIRPTCSEKAETGCCVWNRLNLYDDFNLNDFSLVCIKTLAGLEPARPQWPGDFKCLAPYSRYILVQLIATRTPVIRPFLPYRAALDITGCVTYSSLEHLTGRLTDVAIMMLTA